MKKYKQFLIIGIIIYMLYQGRRTMLPSENLDKIAHAIKTFEGWHVGSKSFRNNNPGNLIYAGQFKAVDDGTGFAHFATYNDGYNALIRQLKLIVSGQSRIYRKDMTFLEIFHIWTSDPEPVPTNYAKKVAASVGASSLDRMVDFV